MKEKVKQFVADKRGVSPVIGVVLMVAVVVILAAVIGAFVLGLGGSQQTTPQASFSLNGGTLVMESGDTLQGSSIKVLTSNSDTDQNTVSGEITAGTQLATGLSDSGTVRVVYTGNGQSSTIWQTNSTA